MTPSGRSRGHLVDRVTAAPCTLTGGRASRQWHGPSSSGHHVAVGAPPGPRRRRGRWMQTLALVAGVEDAAIAHHSWRTLRYALAIGERESLSGVDPGVLFHACLLHDVGASSPHIAGRMGAVTRLVRMGVLADFGDALVDPGPRRGSEVDLPPSRRRARTGPAHGRWGRGSWTTVIRSTAGRPPACAVALPPARGSGTSYRPRRRAGHRTARRETAPCGRVSERGPHRSPAPPRG